MRIIPAIDLWAGKVVRLFKGNPKLSTLYSQYPVEMAEKWKALGAKLLHIVDLSAALGQGDNLEIIEEILKKVDIKIEVGGGIRDLKKTEKLISLGVERVIIGTRSVEDDFLNSLIKLGNEKVAVSVDVVDSNLALKGWQEKTSINALDFIKSLQDKGIKWIIYTDISRDGTLRGMDLEQIKTLSRFKDLNFIVSGGVSSIEDLKRIKKEASFVWGIITGKALYEGKIHLSGEMIDF